MAYVELTWILDRVDRRKTLLINNPCAVRDANEKLYALHFPELCPPTLVTSDRALLFEFLERHREVVFKPLDAGGGEGILFGDVRMRGARALIDAVTAGGKRTLAQAYLSSASEGDTRVLLLDGQALGAVRRVHGAGEERNNLHLGGSAEPAPMTPAMQRIVRTIAPKLREDGLFFVGIDVIGDKLTEINVTSPTGIQELERLSGQPLCDQVIAWCETRRPSG
jgi:glutathione synthase